MWGGVQGCHMLTLDVDPKVRWPLLLLRISTAEGRGLPAAWAASGGEHVRQGCWGVGHVLCKAWR